ncbi:hypothetical protein V502_01397 [Pseudogymnoascus sp. VKM F-4520 (FW-2644)]|nr:hypothetical protein V502_01397 [Pseudogymnoascus sp. VKM F-4520 (FW-2644)]
MISSISSFLLVAVTIQSHFTTAVGTNDQVNADIDYGTFQNPSAHVRPRFRYWPNDASVNLTQVQDDVKEAGRVGAGGVELLGYYFYGNVQLFPGNYDRLQSDWSVYGFGSPAWKELQDTVLSTAQDEGLVVDLALGANQGAGVPAPYDSDGLLWDLTSFEVAVPVGERFNDILPGWGTGALVSASTALVLNTSTTADGGTNTKLSEKSLADITHLVDGKGRVNLKFLSTPHGVEYRVFAYYQVHKHYAEVQAQDSVVIDVPQSPIETYEQNGSWVVDHFSALGAQTVIDFWEGHLLDDSTKKLIKQVGNYVWEDSQEFYFFENTFWTPKMSATFLKNRGYSVNKLYLQTLSNWANRALGVQFSSQVGYNLPMDMMANIPYVNGPETETLAFFGSIDGYRQFAGAANLAGKHIISSESGAEFGRVYTQTIADILWNFKRSVAGSINQFIIHGLPYSGDYGNTTWPGFTSFDYTFSDMHGRHQPGWDFYSDFIGWTSRTQWFAQTGVPKMDVAFYIKSVDYRSYSNKYNSPDLVKAGYSYEYLSPDNFALPEAYVLKGIFAPKRQAFKALVVGADQAMTGLGVAKLFQYALGGLPIVFYGGFPSKFEGIKPLALVLSRATLASLKLFPNVHITKSGQGLADVLASINVAPRTGVSSNGTWYTYWREDSLADYIYVYNDAAEDIPYGPGISMGHITFESTGIPYTYDAWTGDITPIVAYEQTKSHTTVYLELAPDQTTIIAFRRSGSRPFSVRKLPASTLGSASFSSSVSIFSAAGDDTQVTLSNGTDVKLPAVPSRPFVLSNWSLTVESWTSPSDPYDLGPVATRTNLSTITNIDELVPWHSISASLTNVSGRGYYTTHFQWPPSNSPTADAKSSIHGAFIDLGPIYHTVRVTINGHVLPPLDINWAHGDITKYLAKGSNAVEVVVSTPLGNALRVIWDSIKTAGKTAGSQVLEPPAVHDYGLVAPVKIVPFREHKLA